MNSEWFGGGQGDNMAPMRPFKSLPAKAIAAISKKAAVVVAGTNSVWTSVASGYTLSESDKRVDSPNNSAVGGAISNTEIKTSGKLYFEILATTVTSDGDWAAGFAAATGTDPTPNLTSGLVDSQKYLARGNGSSYYNANAGSALGVTFATNDILMVAIDIATGKYWFGKNGTWMLSGDPAADTNNTNPAIGANYRYVPLTSSDNSAGVSAWTLRTTDAACTYTAPSGFAYWDA